MTEPITTELRGVMSHTTMAGIPMVELGEYEFEMRCNAIDAVHAGLERENESLRRELDRTRGEWDYWESTHVELPKDSDGVPIRVGDVMEGEKIGGGYCEPFEVIGYVVSNGELEPMDEHKCPRKHKYSRHHHAPDTWERIIEDAIRGDGGSYGCLEERFNAIIPPLVARCKALAGDAE